MFLENEIEQLGNALLKKAGLEENTSFSITAPFWLGDANAFLSSKRTIYSIPERNFYEFKTLQALFWEKFGTGADTFLAIQQMTIAHEVGHALQSNVVESFHTLQHLKSEDVLADIGSLEELTAHVEKYRNVLVKIEEEAWELGWELIKEDTNKELFELIRTHALRSYREGDILFDENEFCSRYEELMASVQRN